MDKILKTKLQNLKKTPFVNSNLCFYGSILLLPLIYASATFDLAHSLLLSLSYASATFKLVHADVAKMASYLEAMSSGLITIALADILTLNPKPLNLELIGTYYRMHVIIFLDVAKFFANV
jgi:hypothetical protein